MSIEKKEDSRTVTKVLSIIFFVVVFVVYSIRSMLEYMDNHALDGEAEVYCPASHKLLESSDGFSVTQYLQPVGYSLHSVDRIVGGKLYTKDRTMFNVTDCVKSEY